MIKNFKKYQKIIFIILLLVIVGSLAAWIFFKDKKTDSGKQFFDHPISYFLEGNTIEKNLSIDKKGQSLPDNLIIPPGIYKVYGQNYQLEKEGLYRFLDPTNANQQRIVYYSDVNALLSSIAWISVHGMKDVNKSPQELEKKAKIEKLSLNCGAVSLFAKHLLDEQKIKNRIVTSLTLEEWNSYNNGHTMIEVFLDGKWKVFDLDNNVIFNKNGQSLNFLDLSEAVSADNYSIEKIADDPFYDVGGSVEANYNYSFYFETTLLNEKALRDWYKRSLQVPMVGENSIYYFFDETHRLQIESYSKSYKYLPRDEFMRKFY